MSVFKNEDEVIRALKEAWRGYNPYAKINLASYKMDEHFEKWFKTKLPLLTQPEIDIITCEEQGRKLRAHEVKYFRAVDKGINYGFYEGLDEALALLRFGFDDVALVHIFDEEISAEQMNDYAKEMQKLLEATNSPVHYDYYLLKSDKSFDKQYIYNFKATRSNPFLYDENSRKIISLIRGLLRIPSPP